MYRLLADDDAAAFRALRLKALEAHPEAFGSSHEEEVGFPPERWVERIAEQPHLGAFAEERLVGCVVLIGNTGRKTRHKMIVASVFVDEEWRRQGIARRLMEEAIAHARTLPDVFQLQLSVSAGNKPAKALYQSLGFAPFGVERRALKIGDSFHDEDLLQLDLR